jgi:hypothetical protein
MRLNSYMQVRRRYRCPATKAEHRKQALSDSTRMKGPRTTKYSLHEFQESRRSSRTGAMASPHIHPTRPPSSASGSHSPCISPFRRMRQSVPNSYF